MSSDTEPALLFDSIQDSIQAFTDTRLPLGGGAFIIVLDSPDRQNEDDLIIAAESITAAQMAFMVQYTRSYALQLPQMVTENTDAKGTAYTISIDLADSSSITTGISAHDRARTCQALTSPTSSPSAFHRPGHIIPLQARVIAELVKDGVAVEGVAEIRGENGMMRSRGCLEFGKRWGKKVCTIEDLVEYVERMEAGFA
ncbi:DHBP synthase RibB-like alpha/beta domain-containing protein [Aspergillus keveii]|uniref:3,4-dihydroxy-2-butanone-4-phosphate synthase n=1 Tax=Aspergillus keveii TaxID=714993 RepID=A0ABR4FIR9_9EURO